MAHVSYKTKALVLGSLPRGEANSVCILLTPDLGLVYVHAQGIRFEKSKLRFSLQDYSITDIMLVHGKTGWRITNAVCIEAISVDKEALRVVARVSNLVKRLVAGEEKNEELFALCVDNMGILSQKKYSHAELSRIEMVWVLRVLFNLGYIDGDNSLREIISIPLSSISSYDGLDTIRSEALGQINRAIESSQLLF